jgi:steroid Delta-isomerase
MNNATLTRYIALFNEGVRTGNFGPMVARFTDDAELVFENIPVGPFHGRDAIAAAYASQPPDDEIVLLEWHTVDGLLVAAYAWARAPEEHAGDMVITTDRDQIARLVVVYGSPRYDVH